MAVGGQGSHRHVTGLLGSSHLLKVCGFPHPTPSPPRVLGSSSSTSTTGTPGKSPSWPLLQWVSHTHHSDLESRPTLVPPGCSWPAQGRTFLTGTVSSGWHQEVLSPEPTQQWEPPTTPPVLQEFGVSQALEQAAGVKFGMRGAGFNASLKMHFKRVNSSFFN